MWGEDNLLDMWVVVIVMIVFYDKYKIFGNILYKEEGGIWLWRNCVWNYDRMNEFKCL